MAKKRFGISPSTNQALSQTMQMANAQESHFISTDILINRIQLDPENPRRHKITLDDLTNGPDSTDPDRETKQEEYKGLCELAASITKEGLLHPIVVFKSGDDYRLVAGERRFLASIIAKRKIIEARVFKSKPQQLDLRIVQWMENESRKDLSLYKKLLNVSAIIEAHQQQGIGKLTALELSKMLNTSRQSAQLYMAILSNKELMKLIEEGRVSTLKVAQKLSSYKARLKLLEAFELLQANGVLSKKIKPKSINKSKTVGRKRQTVTLGTTTKPFVAKTIVQSVLASNEYSKHSASFETVDWTCLDASTKAFQRFIKLLEKEIGVKV